MVCLLVCGCQEEEEEIESVSLDDSVLESSHRLLLT